LILDFCRKNCFTPVYYCLDRNEYVSLDEISGDVTNVLGVLLYLIAYSYGADEEIIPEDGVLFSLRVQARLSGKGEALSEFLKNQ